MRLASCSCFVALCFASAPVALVACGDDATSDTFKSPYGDPGGSTVCTTGTYLVGWQCLSAGLDASSPPVAMQDAGIDGAVSLADASGDAAPATDASPSAEGAPR